MSVDQISAVESREAVSTRGVVSGEPKCAVQIGANLIAAGGNAADAAAAACLAAAARSPAAVDIGGYVLCAVIQDARGKVMCLDANSAAPALAHESMYGILPRRRDVLGLNEAEYDCSVVDDANVWGPLAVGVPGVVAGIGTLASHWGRMSWTDIVTPSIELLAGGIPYGSVAKAMHTMRDVINRFPTTQAHLTKAGACTKPGPEDVWYREDLQATLKHLSSGGWQDFYRGDVARTIVTYLGSIGGILSEPDMAAFSPRIGAPIATTHREATVYAPPPPSGGPTTLQMLNMLEAIDADAADPAFWHILAEIGKLAWRDRLRCVGDPDFCPDFTDLLVNKRYAAGRVASTRDFPAHVDTQFSGTPSGPSETIHICTADADGMIVSVTLSQGPLFGSCLTVPRTGVILGSGMCRFDPRPGHANSVAARKRPLNNLAPFILKTPDRNVAGGLSGGRRIVTVSAQIAHRLSTQHASPIEVISSPRMHVEAAEPLWVRSIPAEVKETLKMLGHRIATEERVGGAAAVVERRSDRTLHGAGMWAFGA
jgi:gamma-glutamyltranspeptidase/glutathione hydrolase